MDETKHPNPGRLSWSADAVSESLQQAELTRLIEGIKYAHSIGLKVNAGHGLNYHNVSNVAAVGGISELNIGHAIIARAVFSGLKPAVREMKRIMLQAKSDLSSQC